MNRTPGKIKSNKKDKGFFSLKKITRLSDAMVGDTIPESDFCQVCDGVLYQFEYIKVRKKVKK